MSFMNNLRCTNYMNYAFLVTSSLKLQNGIRLSPYRLRCNQFIPENKCFLYTSNMLLAGHSKWQNIKSAKSAADMKKSIMYSKFAKDIRIACQKGGCDPKINTELGKIVNAAKTQSVPNATIERAIKGAQKSKINSKPALVALSDPRGLFVLVDVSTDNLTKCQNDMRSILKSLNFKVVQWGKATDYFEEKGIIITQGDLNKAMDDAIELGAEDVTEEDNALTFTCGANDFFKVRQGLENLKYELDYAEVERIPYTVMPVEDELVEKFETAKVKIEEHDDVLKIHTNFGL